MTELTNLLHNQIYSYRLTGNLILKACRQHKYIILRSSINRKYGINSKMADIAIRSNKPDLKAKTNFVSFTPCTFQEYITYKSPLIKQQ